MIPNAEEKLTLFRTAKRFHQNFLMFKYLLALLLLLPFPALAQTTSTNTNRVDTLTNQFYWLLQIYLDSPCQEKIPVVTPKRTFLVDRTQLLNSLNLLDTEIKNIEPSDPFVLSSVLNTLSRECQ